MSRLRRGRRRRAGWRGRVGETLALGARRTAQGVAQTLRGGGFWAGARIAAALFVLAQARMPDGSHPFAVAMFAALLGTGWGMPSAFAGCLLGVAVGWDAQDWGRWWQVAACAALWLGYPFWRSKGRAPAFPLRAAAVTGVAMLAPLPFLMGGPPAATITCLLGSAAAAATVPVFDSVLALLGGPGRALRPDERFSALLALVSLVLGAARWTLFAACNLGVVLAVGLTLCLAEGCGAAVGMVTGGVLGFALLLVGMPGALCAVLALGGALVGALGTKRRGLCCAAFALAAVAATLCIQGKEGLAALSAAAVGMAGYLFVPQSWRLWMLRYAEVTEEQALIPPEAVGSALAYALEARVHSLRTLAEALPKARAVLMRDEDRLARLAARHCRDCPNGDGCWHQRGEDTARLLTGLLEAAEGQDLDAKDAARAADLIGCIRADDVAQALDGALWEERALLSLQARQNEARTLAGVQLDGLAQAMEGIVRTLRTHTEFLPSLKRRAQRALSQAGLDGAVLTAARVHGRIEILLRCADCARITDLRDALARVAGVPMRPGPEGVQEHLEILFEQEAPLDVEVGLSAGCKRGERVAGDSCLVRRLGGGRQLLAISDGMGSGPRAKQESRASLSLLQQCLRVGFSRGQALSAVNGLLLTCVGEELFATMDLCLLDLHAGEAAFEKLGACTSYVVRGENCRTVAGETLPLGILGSVQPRSVRVPVWAGDLVVLVSDGVQDGFPGGEDGLARLLVKMHAMPAQAISDALLQRAAQNQGACLQDDMTVLCVRLQLRDESAQQRVPLPPGMARSRRAARLRRIAQA
jgi:stage II sporulation protein E